jgi:hypothetical protein
MNENRLVNPWTMATRLVSPIDRASLKTWGDSANDADGSGRADTAAPLSIIAHTTPQPDNTPMPENEPTPVEVPDLDPVPVQDPIPHQQPIRAGWTTWKRA